MRIAAWVVLALMSTHPALAQSPPVRQPDARVGELLDAMGIPREGRPSPAPSRPAARPSRAAPAPAAAAPQGPSPEELARMRQRQSECFAQGRGELEWEARAGAAVVQVLVVTPAGNSVGTGTVIRNSALVPGGANAVLTAFHVVEPAAGGEPGTAMGLVSSAGEPIGWVEVTARGHTGRGGDRSAAASSFQRGDVAVLRVRGFSSPEAERAFRLIEGVDVSRTLNTTLMVGEVSDPAGTNPGISGAAALDPDGNVYGVLVRRSASNASSGNWSVRGVRREGVDPMRRPAADGTRATRTAVLPQSSTTYVEPLLHPEVLAALGGAAAEVAVREGGREGVETMFMGFPSGICVTYRGRMAPAR